MLSLSLLLLPLLSLTSTVTAGSQMRLVAPAVFPPNGYVPSTTGSYVANLLNTNPGEKFIQLTASEIDFLHVEKAAKYSSAAYCQNVRNGWWNCPSCHAIPNFQILATGGDGEWFPNYYIGYDPDWQWLVVAHQGTRTDEKWWNDFDWLGINPSSALGDIPDGTKVPRGLEEIWYASHRHIYRTVADYLEKYPIAEVLVTGHSLGGGMALYDAVNLTISYPKVAVQLTTFGAPRTGNEKWTKFVEGTIHNNNLRITNRNDIVPHFPKDQAGKTEFKHVNNEVWTNFTNPFMTSLCVGTDNPACAESVPAEDWSSNPHDGPYYGVLMGAETCYGF